MAFHYKSKLTIGRLPLIHIAIGRLDGKKVMAVGFFALGRTAAGVVAVGQAAFGVITVAQFGVGLLFGLGQFIAGSFVLAQFALGLVAAVGQFAFGYYSIGQIAAGYMGISQSGWHAVKHNWLSDFFAIDLATVRRFLMENLKFIMYVIPISLLLLFVLPTVLPLLVGWIRARILEVKVQLGMVTLEQAVATILSVTETGIRVNHQPLLELELEYYTKNGQRIQTKMRTPISLISLSGVAPGSQITVNFDPADPTRPFL